MRTGRVGRRATLCSFSRVLRALSGGVFVTDTAEVACRGRTVKAEELQIALVPQGFRFAAVTAGLRSGKGADLALIMSERPAAAAGVFTTNLVAAAPVVLSRAHLRASGGIARAIVANAGNANCATPNERRVAERSAVATARFLNIPRSQVLVASTGVIGVPLEEDRIPNALPRLIKELAPERFAEVASAILTTDTRPKLAFREVPGKGGRSPVRLLGMAKGAGMIHPRMATMLAFVLTDAALPAPKLRRLTRAAVARTFNRISVDGDTSTNDTVFVLANGSAGPVPEQRLAEALEATMGELAKAIAADGEGARRLVQIQVSRARTEREAELIARAVANSALVKTAIAGGDPNWGRILSAAGASGAPLNPARVHISLNGTTVCRRGQAAPFDEAALQAALRAARQVQIHLNVGRGRARVCFWTCDLTEQYIHINASYRT